MPTGVLVRARAQGSRSSTLNHSQFHQEMDLPSLITANENDGECKSGSDNAECNSGDEEEVGRHPKKKRYHRHTAHQIQVMESFFKECPHPDDKQRKELSRELGLEPLQIKFWFQNKRTQMKTQHERHENQQLRNENDKLRAENMRFREALGNTSCPNCGGQTAPGEMSYDEQQLRIENSRLREEIDRISSVAAKYIGKPPGSSSFLPQLTAESLDLYGPVDILRQPAAISSGVMNLDKPMVIQLAVSAMEELMRVARAGQPLWISAPNGRTESINEEEYLGGFSRAVTSATMGLKTEASRESGIVMMSSGNLVEMLMDVNKWSMIFSSIVSRATTLEVLSTGVAGGFNGALQVMSAEFQVPTPLVPTRDSQFVRYCKHLVDGTWAVVDVAVDCLQPGSPSRCRRRPSGCLIEEMPNGYSKVTWVEHVEADDRSVHRIYKSLVSSGLAFGAKRWLHTLERQCQRLASVITNSFPTGGVGVITTQRGRRSMMKLAERMVVSFCSGVGASIAHQWTTLSGTCGEDVRVMTRKSVDDPGRPLGIVLSAATSLWLPVPPKKVFDFLRDENTRSEWDILSNGGEVQEMAHNANGRDEGNCVSLLRVNSANSNQSNMLILQESCTDASGSYVIYAPVDLVAMNDVLNGGDPDYVALLPSGFAILPEGPQNEENGGGSLLTVAFQILVDSQPNAKLSLGSVATVDSLIACTIERIKGNLLGDLAQ
ncbi:homeobox-leucine zipper protein ROC2-like isoform X2 [Wolffia australiana]